MNEAASPYWDTLAVTTVTAVVAKTQTQRSSCAAVSGLCSLCLSCCACGQVGAPQTMCWDHRLRGQTSVHVLSVPKDGDLITFSAVLTLETSVARWQREFRLGICLVSSLPSHFLIQPLPIFFQTEDQLDANVMEARIRNMVDVLGATPVFLTPTINLTLTLTLTPTLTLKNVVYRKRRMQRSERLLRGLKRTMSTAIWFPH